MTTEKTSQISKFYQLSLEEKQKIIEEWIQETINHDENLDIKQAEHIIENVIGILNLPFGIATNFKINSRDFLIPMVVEEPSIIAAASYAAKLFRSNGGFTTNSDAPIMIGQIQILDVDDLNKAEQRLKQNLDRLINKANESSGSIIKRGGGIKKITIRPFPTTPIGKMIVLHILYDTRDAMGANAVNTAVEYITPDIEEITGGRVNLRILSNLTDQRKVYAEGTISESSLETKDVSGEKVIRRILEAATFAEIDPYRAATHNKGIMNGIDPVVVATGNDWRAVEAGAHAYVARGGSYTSLTKWRRTDNGDLHGSIELPLSVGIVGGATRVHPKAQLALKILGVTSATELAEVMAAVGLAQNLAAMRALATTGIQKGHMRLHARQLAIAAGAAIDDVKRIVETMVAEGNIRLERAKELVKTGQE